MPAICKRANCEGYLYGGFVGKTARSEHDGITREHISNMVLRPPCLYWRQYSQGISPRSNRASWTTERVRSSEFIADSLLQMTVNLGQGANCAIEDVAVLCNLLDDLLKEKGKEKPSGQEVDALLRRFNTVHLPRASEITAMSWFTTRVHARDGFVRTMLGRYVATNLGSLLEGRPFKMIANASSLAFLPLPRTSSPGWEKYRDKKVTGGLPLFLLPLASVLLVMLWRYH